MYKPRSLATDGHFKELLNWVNRRGSDPPLRSVRTLDRGRHGWAEYVQRESCATEEEVQRFYRPQGAYLAIFYVSEATDFHCENLIAAGEYPMPVDLEALFHPCFSKEGQHMALDLLGSSVLKVGLLPTHFDGVDISGLGGAAGQPIPQGVPQWENTETDEMCLVRKQMEMRGAGNRPQYQGHEVDVLGFASEIGDGFEAT